MHALLSLGDKQHCGHIHACQQARAAGSQPPLPALPGIRLMAGSTLCVSRASTCRRSQQGSTFENSVLWRDALARTVHPKHR